MSTSRPSEIDVEVDTPPPNRRRLFMALVAALLSLLLVGAELLARVHYEGRFPTSTVYHPLRGHAHRPNWSGLEGKARRAVTARFNKLGLRADREFERRFAGRRVLVLGDSVVFGYRLAKADTIPTRLESALAADGGSWQTMNVGCYGYGLPDARAWLEELAPRFSVDLVLLCVCYNDFGQPLTRPGPAPAALTQALTDHCALFLAIVRKRRQLQRSVESLRRGTPSDAQIRNMFRVDHAEAEGASKRLLEETLIIERLAKSMGARLAVVLWSGQDQFEAYQASGALPPEQLSFARMLKASAPSVRLLQPLPALAEHGESDRLFMDHCHPSSEGVRRLTPLLVELTRATLGPSSK